MKFSKLFALLVVISTLTGCARSSEDVWDDTKTASRHMQKGIKSFCGIPDHSRPYHRREDFLCSDGDYCGQPVSDSGFITLPDDPTPMSAAANISPGDPGSSVPGIDAFQDPQNNPELAGIFQNIHFPLNSSLIKGTENMNIVRAVSDYMKSHENAYLFIEGHCDERGAEAYNLALGSRRSNTVSEELVKHGVDPQRLFTVSYGKERPIVPGMNEETWALNRRAQFKIYWQ